MSHKLPEATRRLFQSDRDLVASDPAGLIERLLEEGDRRDLGWLARAVGESSMRRWMKHSGFRLSNRSRAFWEMVLEVRAPDRSRECWPL